MLAAFKPSRSGDPMLNDVLSDHGCVWVRQIVIICELGKNEDTMETLSRKDNIL